MVNMEYKLYDDNNEINIKHYGKFAGVNYKENNARRLLPKSIVLASNILNTIKTITFSIEIYQISSTKKYDN